VQKEVKTEIVYEWWKEEEALPEGKKWRFLEHNGVIFPPTYEVSTSPRMRNRSRVALHYPPSELLMARGVGAAQPHGVKMKYNGEEVELTVQQEAIATMYAAMLRTDYIGKTTFINNFWREFKQALGKGHKIQELKKCDFQPILNHLDAEREKKKNLTKEEKLKIKEKADKLNAPYATIVLDSHTEKNGNYRVEPAGLFRGRGEHPKMGQVKQVIQPEDITMNVSVDACPPRCPLPGRCWQSVVHKDDTTWLAYYKDTINGDFKYIFLSAGSSLKGQSDREKFEKARELKKYVKQIRQKVTTGLVSKEGEAMQHNTALWLIDNLAIRAGNEKDTSEEADTVGCCSLRVEHITLAEDEDGKTIYFCFLGKDSIEYKNLLKLRPSDEARAREGEEDPNVSFVREGEEKNFLQVWKNMGALVGRKGATGDKDVFHSISTSSLNAYLKELMPGLTAKVFRTYNASITLDQELAKLEDHPKRKDIFKSDALQLKFYNDANYQVAILCNHSRTVSKSFDTQMSKMDEKADAMSKELKDLQKSLKKADNKDQVKKKVASLEERLHKHEVQKQIKQKLSGVALSTSKVNYLDPRISVAWCKKYGDFALGKVFNKSLLTKFKWAIDEADEDFRF